MEPFPTTLDRPVHSKDLSRPQVRIDELRTPDRTRSGPAAKSTYLRRANTVAQGSSIKKNLELKANRERTTTTGTAPGAAALRAKDSHELLRNDRPLQRSQTHRGPLEARPAGRRAGHFTVGSVGQNGKIFLRPIANTPQKDPPIVPFSSIDQVTTDRLQPHRTAQARDDPSRWSSSQLSELRPRERVRDEYKPAFIEASQPEIETRSRQRPNSFSTISDKQSVSGAGKRGELRIVIDRSEDRPKTANENSPDTALEIPIPHYRLGSPRFNTEGSAMLHSSVYTRTSMSDNFRNSTLLGGMIDPMPGRPGAYSRDSFSRHRASFAVSMFSGTAAIDLSRASPIPRNSMVYELKGPVQPSIYETLVSDMDGETVVRYIPGTKDISAATPARIVAQISSESFMDYELVSDFFLTFRCYLSADHLLALLLARLQWAINRPQEDGRIIRIRTFAALRHWILNYFVDDFVMNYQLRTHFCETINELYQDVKSRQNGGTSDLKILIDLKRCWNGKCSVYWTASDYSRAYNDPDSAIMPGSAQIELHDDETAQQTVPLPAMTPHVDTSSRKSFPTVTQHDRNDSAGTAHSIPFSSKSDQSMLALSCSLPPKSLRRVSTSYARSKAPRPVALGLTKSISPNEAPPTSPMLSRHPFHGHKRSGSFSDSVRDDRLPTGMDSGSPAPPQEMLDPVRFIRGELYPPAESYMAMMVPDSPPLAAPSSSTNSDRRSTDGGPKTAQSNSGMKTIIGSIRRALHTRNGGQSVSARMTTTSELSSLPSRGKTSAMPHHIALGSEYYRERKMATVPKRPARIDILCERSLKQYRDAMEQAAQQDAQQQPDTPTVQVTYQEPGENIPVDSLQVPEGNESKIKSGITMGSESIVIVDDTGFEFPTMSGAVQDDQHRDDNDQTQYLNTHDMAIMSSKSLVSSSTQAKSEHSVPICFNGEVSDIRKPYPQSIASQRRSFSNESQAAPRKRVSLSLRLRKYASFQSGISRQRNSMDSDAGKSSVSSQYGQDLGGKNSGPALRRRPGGNLRQMQVVGDDQMPARGSIDTARSYNDSLAETTMTASEVPSRPQSTLIPPNPRYSLIQGRPNRDQKRRSFEAAIARFAQIPDDDDGGVESTLLKLEGKWPNSPPPDEEKGFEKNLDPGVEQQPDKSQLGWDALARRRQTDMSGYSTVGGRLAPPRPYSDSVAESEESYNSIPLLERGLTDESMKRPPVNRPHIHSQIIDIQGPPLSLISSRDTSELVSSHPSIQIVNETDSIRRIPRGSTIPQLAAGSTGHVTPRNLSEMSVDIIDRREAIEGRLSSDTRSLNSSTVEIPPHPLAHPPSPPMTIQHPSSFNSCVSPLDKVLFQAQPLTPDTSPRRREAESATPQPRRVPEFSSDVLSNSEKEQNEQYNVTIDHGPDHVPFVLACESQMLAQQLTLVEMAALSEVDWRDLVEMRWSSGSQCIESWVQFLISEERKGIDLVVGRFNLVVKWVVSEIVLTRNINERARTIIKFIHTAAHARRICNYATMLQIAIALSSSDCSRLQRTWQLVPLEDRRLFKDMEALIQPVRNFHDLRVEMETANLREGCIPFIGLYVHDLTYNAQKPAQITRKGGDLLVNFERYRTAARLVKSLLRLIDASTKYRFMPVQGVIERCLWMSSLREDEIQARSKDLE